MGKTYERAPIEVEQRAKDLIERYHKDLENTGVTIDFIYATDPDGSPVTSAGYPALAVAKIVPLKDRAVGRRDAEIVIDQMAYELLSDPQKDALLDHELAHFIVRRDDMNDIMYDDLSRPKLKLRLHDVQAGWFVDVAQRHGHDSAEVVHAKNIWAKHGLTFFPFVTAAPEATDE